MLGEAPSRSTDRHRHPLSGETGRRLAEWAGVHPADFHRRVECRNLLGAWPGAQGTGSRFPLDEARAAWRRLVRELDGRAVLLLGARLAALAGVDETPPYAWREEFHVELGAALRLCWMPHPSGLNHWWNAEPHVYDARVFLAGLVGSPPPQRPRALRLPM